MIFFSFFFLGREEPLERDRLPTPAFLGFPGGSDSKEPGCKAGGLGSVPGLGRSAAGEHGNPAVFLPGESPRTEEPGGLQSVGSQRVGHD